MSDTAVLFDEIQSLPPDLAAAGKSSVLPRFTRAQVEAAAKSPEIQALAGAIPDTGLPPDIT